MPAPAPAIPQAGAAISCPARECAGQCHGRGTRAERRAWAGAGAPGHPLRPSRGPRASPAAALPPPGTRGRESGAAPRVPHWQRSLPSRGCGSAPGTGQRLLPLCEVLLIWFGFGSWPWFVCALECCVVRRF